MKTIKIETSIPNLCTITKEDEDGNVTIIIKEEDPMTLGSIALGQTVKLGNREYIVLGHGEETTAVITKKSAQTMRFGANGDYTQSDVREYCNGKFYEELVAAVGKDNIVKHTVNLMADDGTGKGKVVQDYVSILTADLYRRYRAFLPPYGDWWWTATRVSDDDSLGYARAICFVNSSGILSWDGFACSGNVRPFCILKSSILIS